MTRINCGIPPSELTKQHLITKHREIKRIPNCIKKGRYNLKGQPGKFTLGTGHVKFFYTRLGYLKKRYEELYAECLSRNINAQYYGAAWDNIPLSLMGDYIPTVSDKKIVRDRISERLKSTTKPIIK
jgi:hypothetical protein